MKLHYTITTDSPYPIETKGIVPKCSGWQVGARIAVKAHKDNMKEKGKSRRWGDKVVIKLIRLPEDTV